MNYKKVNEVLSNLNGLGKYKLVSSDKSEDFGKEKSQGYTGTKTEIRDLGVEGLFLKVTYHDNSYGNDERIVGLQFVKPATVKVVDYKPIED